MPVIYIKKTTCNRFAFAAATNVRIGCGMAFISWLLTKRYKLAQIAQQMVTYGDAGTFAALYGALISDNPANTWPSFLNDVYALPGDVNSDNPFGWAPSALERLGCIQSADISALSNFKMWHRGRSSYESPEESCWQYEQWHC